MTVLGYPRSWSCHCLPVLILLLGIGHGPWVEGVTHYKPGDPVILYVNKVGPYHNPQETYHYYQLPVCCPEKIRHKSLSLGEVLDGDRMAESLYYIFATVWGREQYTLYGILFFVFAILLSVGACISIALTYFQLSGEDYRWWWRSVLSVGSTGLFIFLYSVFYYARRSNMSGAVQTVEFFGYSLLTGYVFFLMLGTISFFSSLKFIRYIYVNLKMD